jgi:two-component system, cell cycle sensor histidine kinase PleC
MSSPLLLSGDALPSEPAGAGALAIPVPPVPLATTCDAVYDRLVTAPEAPGVVVIDPEARPLGLVSRHTAQARYAERYGAELYGKKPIEFLMDERPLIVDEATPISELGRQVAVDHPTALVHGFIVTARGRYRGIGTGQALIRAKVERDARQTLQLRGALAESARARKAMSNFLAMMSHELRTPLNAIIGFSDLLQREQFGPLGQERYVDYARDIHGAGSHLLSVITDILDLSKAEAGKLEIRPVPVGIEEIAAACIRLTAERSQSAGLSLTAQIQQDLPLLDADELKVKQMVLNLLSNAIKFTPAGGSVTLSAALDGGELVVAVTDTGIGIAAADLPTALAPFGQVNSPIGRTAEGTGLGLPLVKALMELHGGRLVLDSRVGDGTTAMLVFPRERVLGPGSER